MDAGGLSRILSAVAALALAAFGGCANPGADERRDHAAAFRDRLLDETESVLRDLGGVMTLSNAVELAHSRTLKLVSANLEAELARINRAKAFSAFLPSVELAYSPGLLRGEASSLPIVSAQSTGTTELGLAAATIAQPVFTPVAWTMFAESLYGVRIQELVREHAARLLDIKVAALFCRAAVAERQKSAYELQLDSARELTNRVSRLRREGYATEVDLKRAEIRFAQARLGLVEACDSLDRARAELCEILDLWPLARFRVDGDSLLTLAPPEELSAAEWTWRALLTRLDLYAGDQLLELRKAQVVETLAAFLPNIMLGGGAARLSIEDVALSAGVGSLTGVWSVFSGFRTVQDYRAAKARREAEFKLQEDRMLAVVVAVADAWRVHRAARLRADTARLALAGATLDHRAAERRFEEGQETFSAVLDKLVVRSEAEVAVASTDYAAALAALMLREAVGEELFARKEEKSDAEKP